MEHAEQSSTVSAERAMSVFTKAQHAIDALEALDLETLSDAEREARENTLEQMYAVAAYVSKEYPSSVHLRGPEEGVTSPME
jgi:hypothetical protein